MRRRLALTLAALLVVTGVALLAASYLLVSANLNHSLAFNFKDRPALHRPQGAALLSAAPPTSQPSPALVVGRARAAHRVRKALLAQYGLVLAALTLVAGVVAWLVAGRVLRPLRAITAGARRITHERLSERLALSGPDDELKELGDTFDSMLARLETAFEDQQLFAANAAHELRTPFTVLRGELELMLTGPTLSADQQRSLATRLLRTTQACERLTERLLTLSRGQVTSAERLPVPLDELVLDQLQASAATINRKRLTVSTDLRPALAHGDTSLLRQLVENLIENAIRHNHPRGWIKLLVRTDYDHVLLVVANSGQRLSQQQLPALLEPFRRANQQRIGDSTGLGLSIVRTIVNAHDGSLALNAITDGGLEAQVTLPACANAPSAGDRADPQHKPSRPRQPGRLRAPG